MNRRLLNALLSMRALPVLALVCLFVAILSSCGDEKKDIMAGTVNPETFPTMMTKDVVTLISDSGITRYMLRTPLWLVFEDAVDPYWRFPDSLHIEKYDNYMRVDASIDCDSAMYFKNRQLWRLDGYVNIRNTAGEKFLTNQLFWDQRGQKVYSDSFIHIERDGKIIEGYGFESNDRMTQYKVLQVSGIFPAEQFRRDTTDSPRPMIERDSAVAPKVMPKKNIPSTAVPTVIVPSGKNKKTPPTIKTRSAGGERLGIEMMPKQGEKKKIDPKSLPAPVPVKRK